MKIILNNQIRFTVLNENIFRLEYEKNGVFEDRNTFVIPNRQEDESLNATLYENDEKYIINFESLSFEINKVAKELSGLKVFENNEIIYKYKKIKNSGELPEPNKTPVMFALMDNNHLILPKYGYTKKSVDNGENYVLDSNKIDLYLIKCDKNPVKLRYFYCFLTGKPEMIRFSDLGFWSSRYYAYTQNEAKEMIEKYERLNLPLDNLVIDTDWRETTKNGMGYEINKKLFPDMKEFIDFAHSKNITIMFNDHPEPQDGCENMFDKKELVFRYENLTNHLKIGLDTWWYDRNWICALVSPFKDEKPFTYGQYIFNDIENEYFKELAGNDKIYKRPIIMCNAHEITNGNYKKIESSSTHRYSFQWTGDNLSQGGTIKKEIYNTLRAGENCIPYVHPDLGGHIGDPDKNLYLRWMQFGTFLPIERVHCTCSVRVFREPWNYDEEVLDLSRKYVNLRYRMIPMYYALAHQSYETGMPILKSLRFNYPSDKNCEKLMDEYLIKDDLLVKPISDEAAKIVEKKYYSKKVTAIYYGNKNLEGKPIKKAVFDSINFEHDGVGPIDGVPPYNYSAVFETEVCFDHDVELYVAEDDGSRVYIDGKIVHDAWFDKGVSQYKLLDCKKNQKYKIKIEYYQAGMGAALKLLYMEYGKSKYTKVYLPEGEWINPYNGKIFEGKKNLRIKLKFDEIPLFIRRGSLFYFVKEENNTTLLDLSKLYFDYYPSKIYEDNGYVYDDDHKTTAYKYDIYSKINYSTCYENGEYKIVFKKAEGSFKTKGKKCAFKFHLLDKEKVKEVFVNDKIVKFSSYKKNRKKMIFEIGKSSKDTDVVLFSFKYNPHSSIVIRIKIEK